MRRKRKIHVPALLQSCTSSMTAGFRLTVHKDDSFQIEDGNEITVRIAQGNNGSIDRRLFFYNGYAQLEIDQLPYDWYTLSLVDDNGHSIEEKENCFIRFLVNEESGEGNQLRFQLNEQAPRKEIEMNIYGDVSELTIHVLQNGAQGQHMPNEDAIYQYELVSSNYHQWIELNACNQYEVTMFLPKDLYTLTMNEQTKAYFDDELIEDSILLQEDKHSLAIIESEQSKAVMQISVFVMDEQCVLTAPKDCYFQVRVQGNGFSQTINLNEMNDFSMMLYDLEEGVYQLAAHAANGYTILYEIDGETSTEGIVEVGAGCRCIHILYQSNQAFHRPSFRIRKMVKGEGGCLLKPKDDDCFIVAIRGCGTTHSFYLTKENRFCVELADLCPGTYQIEEIDAEGYVSHLQYANGELIINGCVEICPCQGTDVLLVNEVKNNGKLQICKYEEDAQGNLIKPQGNACYAIRLHSFAYQEIIMLKEDNDYCVFLQQLAKGCYDIREVGGEHVLYSVDQGEWSNAARVVIDDDRLHEIRVLNLQEEDHGSVRIEKWMENEHCMLMHPSCNERYMICLSGNGVQEKFILHAQNQWCVYVDDLPYGEYQVEELYGGNERYVVNGKSCTQAVIQVQKEMQEVKIINPLPHMTTLQLSLCMVDCAHQMVYPDQELEAIVVVEGDDFCREVVLNEENRWQALVTGMKGDSIRVIQKDTMGYHVMYKVDGQLCAGALIAADGKRHEVVLIDQYRCVEGSLWIEKKWVDDAGCMHSPQAHEHFNMLLQGCGLEIPFTLQAENGFCVCFDDLRKGTYEIIETEGEPYCFCVNGQDQDNGIIQMGTQDVHIDVINQKPCSPRLYIAYQSETECMDEIHFTLAGNEVHAIYALQANAEHLVIEDLSPGAYELIIQGNERILFEINGNVYEKGRFTLDQRDVSIVLIQEAWENCLTLQKYQQNDQGAYEVEEQKPCSILVTTSQGPMQVWLNESNGFTQTLYDLPVGEICITDQTDEHAKVFINGKQTQNGCFWLCEGRYEAKLISESKTGGCIEINGSCRKNDEYHECVHQHIRLLLKKGDKEQFIELTPENEWHVVVGHLSQGRYTLCSLDQTISFYADEIQSYNVISIQVKQAKTIVQAVLHEEQPQPLVSFQILLQDEQGNPLAIQQDALFTARVQGTHFYETLVFDNTNQYSLQRVLPSGVYEMFVNGAGYGVYAYALIDGRKQPAAQIEISDNCKIQFVFVKKEEQRGTLYVQGYRQDHNCDCLKPPYPDTVFSLTLTGEGRERAAVLNEENHWRMRINDLSSGTYELVSSDLNPYVYMVDGKECTQPFVDINQDVHNIKVILEEENKDQGALVVEAWRWNGKQKEKPASALSLWIKVKNENDEWDLLLNEGNHWLGMIEHLDPGTYEITCDHASELVCQVDGAKPVKSREIKVGNKEMKVDLLLKKEELGSITIKKRMGGQLLPLTQKEYTFMLQAPGYETQILMNEQTGYDRTIENLSAGRYVLEELGEYAPTYRVDGGSERNHAIVDVDGDAHEVIVINVDEEHGASLRVRGNGLSLPADFVLQKAGMEHKITLNEENGYQQEVNDLSSGRYSLFAEKGAYLYELDGQSKRSYCTIVMTEDDHEVVITPYEDELEIPAFAQKDNEASKGTVALRLWQRDARGELRRPSNNETVMVSIGAHQAVLSEEGDYEAVIEGMSYGEYPLTASAKCSYQIDGGMEQKEVLISIHSPMPRQVDLILTLSPRQRQTTKLIL